MSLVCGNFLSQLWSSLPDPVRLKYVTAARMWTRITYLQVPCCFSRTIEHIFQAWTSSRTRISHAVWSAHFQSLDFILWFMISTPDPLKWSPFSSFVSYSDSCYVDQPATSLVQGLRYILCDLKNPRAVSPFSLFPTSIIRTVSFPLVILSSFIFIFDLRLPFGKPIPNSLSLCRGNIMIEKIFWLQYCWYFLCLY